MLHITCMTPSTIWFVPLGRFCIDGYWLVDNPQWQGIALIGECFRVAMLGGRGDAPIVVCQLPSGVGFHTAAPYRTKGGMGIFHTFVPRPTTGCRGHMH